MSDPSRGSRGRPLSADERRDLTDFLRALRESSPTGSRRDLLRWSALATGAIATARFGLASTEAAPVGNLRAPVRSYQDEEVETDAEISVPFNPFGQAVTLDPHRTVNWGPFWVLFPNVWGGLLRYTETGEVVEDLAESFAKSDDGLTYTFKIRPDARYANGRQVVADHFIASWKRALDPDNLSPMATFMKHVEGYQDYIDKKSDEIGFRAVDEGTVEVRLAQPFNYFTSFMASFVWSVVDPQVIEAEGEENFPLKDAGTGPWRFVEFEPDTRLIMERNPEHYGGTPASLARIVWQFVTGPEAEVTALDLYRNDQAVSADVPISLLDEVTGDETLSAELVRVQSSASTRSLAMDFTKPPFDDVRVRRAFALATDRERWANDIFKGTYTPTGVFTPPVVSIISTYQPPEGQTHDPDAARDLLEEAGYPDGDGLPEIVYFQSSEDPEEEIDRWAAFLATYEETLGVKIVHDLSRTAEQIDDLREDEGGLQFASMWWWTITETPQLLSEVFRTDSGYMDGWFNWSTDLEPVEGVDADPGSDAARFDELTAQADLEQDEDARDDLYRQAEELVLRNAVYIPLGNWVQMFVQKPWLQGTKQGPWTGRLPARFDKDVVVLKH